MSKQVKRKITVNLSPKTKTLTKTRPSVFERLGTKAGSSTHKEFCHHWAQNGTCPYSKACKYNSTHTLISPSKQRAAKKENEAKKKHPKETHKRLRNVVKGAEGDWNQWDPDELADADPELLEKRRAELQRELELQMKMESKHKKIKKIKKETTPSSESSSSSTESSSSSDESSTSSSASETRKKKNRKLKIKRDTSTSSEDRVRKHKGIKRKRSNSKSIGKNEKIKKIVKPIPRLTTKSPTPVQMVKKSQTPPPKVKESSTKRVKSESKSPRPMSRSSDRKVYKILFK